MQKIQKTLIECVGNSQEISHNITENVKYIKQLELQRVVLKKLIDCNQKVLHNSKSKIATNFKLNNSLIKEK
jgi:hypothetical protein